MKQRFIQVLADHPEFEFMPDEEIADLLLKGLRCDNCKHWSIIHRGSDGDYGDCAKHVLVEEDYVRCDFVCAYWEATGGVQ